MNRVPLVVKASWDSEAKVWLATSADIPGLVTEAGDWETLVARVLAVVPDLLEDASEYGAEVPISVIVEQDERVKLRA